MSSAINIGRLASPAAIVFGGKETGILWWVSIFGISVRRLIHIQTSSSNRSSLSVLNILHRHLLRMQTIHPKLFLLFWPTSRYHWRQLTYLLSRPQHKTRFAPQDSLRLPEHLCPSRITLDLRPTPRFSLQLRPTLHRHLLSMTADMLLPKELYFSLTYGDRIHRKILWKLSHCYGLTKRNSG
jgi:hypothetical protein